MLDKLTTEASNPASEALDTKSPLEIVRLINVEDAGVAAAVGRVTPAVALAIEKAVERLRAGGRLVYIGAGTSGRLGVLDAAECPPTFSAPRGQVVGIIAGGAGAMTASVEGAEDRPELAVEDLRAVSFNGNDLLVGIATSGRTPYVLGALSYARSIGAYTVAISCNDDCQLNESADLAIVPVVGPEVLSGSTRMKAGTATKMVLNMISTGTMVLLGKTYGNLMVDLRATNSKLTERARRIVKTLTRLSDTEANELLRRCDGEVKTAIVVHRQGATPEMARQALSQHNGHLRRALGERPDGAD
ncbi:MAG: N-acetylmuramic acid 6-phosphate etherase [Pirellulaceae bacterium]|nr:N-acetylmuramic acid 6-phosphate etherase [Planctomycetales bacterium]